MTRQQMIDLVVDHYKTFGHDDQVEILRETLKRIPDLDLAVLIQNLGIKNW